MEYIKTKYVAMKEFSLPLEFFFIFLDWHVEFIPIPAGSEFSVQIEDGVGILGDLFMLVEHERGVSRCFQSSIIEMVRSGDIVEVK